MTAAAQPAPRCPIPSRRLRRAALRIVASPREIVSGFNLRHDHGRRGIKASSSAGRKSSRCGVGAVPLDTTSAKCPQIALAPVAVDVAGKPLAGDDAVKRTDPFRVRIALAALRRT